MKIKMVIKRLKPLEQVLKEGKYEQCDTGYFSRNDWGDRGFVIRHAMFKNFGGIHEFEEGENRFYYKNHAYKKEMFEPEPDDFLDEKDFEL